ncbi:MAG: cysteine desulfurase NifS [Thermodesulfobacteriota bacterium]
MNDVIYMDNNATTRVAPEVVDEMTPFFSQYYGNPSSMHTFGGMAGRKLSEAREKLAALINASPDEIIFTSCGTESDSTAIWGALKANPDKRHIVTTRVEHPAVKNLCENLEKNGYRVTWVPVDREGGLDIDYLYESLADDTAIVSVMWANNETGMIFPVEQIARAAAERGICFHTDAVQAIGKLPVDVKSFPVNMLSLAGHKFHAPKGVGALYLKKGTKFSPFLIGGHQEGGRRGGTENTASIIGLGRAAELASEHLESGIDRIRGLRDRLESGIMSKIPNTLLNGAKDRRLPNTMSVSFEYVEGEAILLMLDQLGICASSGSACTSGTLEPSHVLRAMGVPFTAAHGSVRLSLSRYTTEDEVDSVVSRLPGIIDRLRQMSPFWKAGSCDVQ